MSERSIIKIDGFWLFLTVESDVLSWRDVNKCRFGYGDLHHLKIDPAFTDKDRISVIQHVLELHFSINENMIHASIQLAAFDKAIDYFEITVFRKYKSVLSRDAAVIQNDVILLSPANGEGRSQIDLRVKGSAGWFSDCKSGVQCIRNCNG